MALWITSSVPIFICCILLVSSPAQMLTEAEEEHADYEDQPIIEDAAASELSRRADVNDQSAVSGDYDYDERRPRGLWAALFGYPDEFDGKDPVKASIKIQEGKRQNSEQAVRGRTIGNFGNTRDLKKPLAYMSKTVPKHLTSPSKTYMPEKPLPPTSLRSLLNTSDNATVIDDFSGSVKNFTNDTIPDEIAARSNNISDITQSNSTTSEEVDEADYVSQNSTNLESFNNSTADVDESPRVSGSTSNKREANPSRSTNGPSRQPFNGQLQPLPAGYILWHPVPPGQNGGAGISQLPLPSDRSQSFLPPPSEDDGPPARNFIPHRPMFVEPPSRDFRPHGPMPITEFSSPPVFAVMPDHSRQGEDGGDDDRRRNQDRTSNKGRNKKPGKGSKNRNRSKGRRPQESDEPEFQPRPPPPPMMPVHVMLPPLQQSNEFADNPEFGPRFPPHFGPNNGNEREREQFISNGPFRNRRPEQPGFQQQQPMRQPGFQQEQPIRQPGFQQEHQIRQPGFQQEQRPSFQAEQSIRQPQFQPQRDQSMQPEFSSGPNHPENFHNRAPMPERQNDDGHRGQNSKRPSPTPSAHPAKFEIDRVKKLQEHFENRPNTGLLPVPQLPPLLLSPGFSPDPAPQRQFDFPAGPQPFSFSSPPPQFLDASNNQNIRGDPEFVTNSPLRPTQDQSFETTSKPFIPDFLGPVHHIPPLSLPPAEPFQQDVGDFIDVSTPQSLTDESVDGQALLYTRDFRKQANEIGLTTPTPRPLQFTSTTKRPPVKSGSVSQHASATHVQRFPAIPHSSKLSSSRSQQEKKNSQQDNQQPNTFFDQPAIWHPLNRPQGSFTENQKRGPQRNTDNLSLAASQRLPETHPNLPDFKYHIGPVDRHISTSTTATIEQQSFVDSSDETLDHTLRPNEADSYASPGFNTGHKGYPSSVTAPSFITPAVEEQSTILQPTASQRPWSVTQIPGKQNLATTTMKPKNFFGTTFQSSFVSTSRGSPSPNGPSYHYEIKYQTPKSQQRGFIGTTNKPLLSSSTIPTRTSTTYDQDLESAGISVTTHAPFGVDKAPEYASPTFQPAEGQGGAYRPGTSRILLEMGQWRHKSDDEQQTADSQMLDIQANQ